MTFLLIVALLILYVVLCRYIWKARYVPRTTHISKESKKRRKNLEESLSAVKSQKELATKVKIANLMRRVPIIGFSESRKQDIRVLLAAMDKRDERGRLILAEEIYYQQLQMAAVTIGLAFLAALVLRTPMCLIAIGAAPLAMSLAIKELQEGQDEVSKCISEEFLGFYKLYYAQFSRKEAHTTLRSVVESYMPRASLDFRAALGRFASDLESGEDYALANLDIRYPDNMKIHKFCSVARARAKGDDAAYLSMHAFLTELEEEQDAYFDADLVRRQERLQTIYYVYLFGTLTLIMGMLMIGMSRA